MGEGKKHTAFVSFSAFVFICVYSRLILPFLRLRFLSKQKTTQRGALVAQVVSEGRVAINPAPPAGVTGSGYARKATPSPRIAGVSGMGVRIGWPENPGTSKPQV